MIDTMEIMWDNGIYTHHNDNTCLKQLTLYTSNRSISITESLNLILSLITGNGEFNSYWLPMISVSIDLYLSEHLIKFSDIILVNKFQLKAGIEWI